MNKILGLIIWLIAITLTSCATDGKKEAIKLSAEAGRMQNSPRFPYGGNTSGYRQSTVPTNVKPGHQF